ncbi:MAG TPA: zf-HC2 domain-containing protein [Terriglobia bacterium]|nr:zf-HC2 domain-containing protein [Terriglobia bacterium]
MNCKRYQNWIPEAALGALGASRQAQLDAHVLACPACARALEAERRLLAAIDQGLARNVAAQPSAEFAARVRMRLAEEREQMRPSAGWLPGRPILVTFAALAALAALVLAVRFVQRAPQRTQLTTPSAPIRTATPSARELATVTRPPARALLPAPTHRASGTVAHGSEGARSGRENQTPQLQVLVRPGQWAGITALYRAAQSGRVDTSSLAERPAMDLDPLQVPPVEIKPLVTAALEAPKPLNSSEAEDIDTQGDKHENPQ